MIGKIKTSFQNLYTFVRKSLVSVNSFLSLPFGFFLIVLNLFMLIAFINFESELFNYTLVYGLLVSGMLAYTNHKLAKISLREGLIKYGVTFFIGISLLSIFGKGVATQNFTQVAVMFALVVAINESIIFVEIIPTYLQRYIGSSARGASALLFSAYHIPAYYINATELSVFIFQLLFAFSINLIFQYISTRKNLGLPVVMALHSLYDLHIFGVI